MKMHIKDRSLTNKHFRIVQMEAWDQSLKTVLICELIRPYEEEYSASSSSESDDEDEGRGGYASEPTGGFSNVSNAYQSFIDNHLKLLMTKYYNLPVFD